MAQDKLTHGTVWLPKELIKELKVLAVQDDRSLVRYVKRTLEQHVKEQQELHGKRTNS